MPHGRGQDVREALRLLWQEVARVLSRTQQHPGELERGVLLRGVDGKHVAKMLEGPLAVAPPEREKRRLPANRDAVRVGAERRVQGLAGVVAVALAVEEAGEVHPRVRIGRAEP